MKSNSFSGFPQTPHPQAEQEKERKMLKKEKSATGITDFVFKQFNNTNGIDSAQHQKPVQLNFMRLLLQNSAGGENDSKN